MRIITISATTAFLTLSHIAQAQQPTIQQITEGSASVIDPIESKISTINGFVDYDPKAKPFAYVASAAIWQWPQGARKVIYVCWENPDDFNKGGRDIVKQAITETWQLHSQLRFEGWEKCVDGNYGIHIKIDDIGPHTKGLGRQLDRKTDGMALNFSFNKWGTSCKENEDSKRSCIYSIAVHEFGHAIGYAHEQNRFDAPGECRSLRQGSNGDLLLTPYDPESVMNYCNDRYNNYGKLSEKDIRALTVVYGAP